MLISAPSWTTVMNGFADWLEAWKNSLQNKHMKEVNIGGFMFKIAFAVLRCNAQSDWTIHQFPLE